MLQVFTEDQYAICDANTSLTELRQQLPAQLPYRAPMIPIGLGQWLHTAGFGLANAAPVRQDVLGLTYQSDKREEKISVGGKVVKNVQGYDAVRFLVGHDPNLSSPIKILQATLRLRPSKTIQMRQQKITEQQKQAALQELKNKNATYAFVYEHAGQWFARAEWWEEDCGNWGEATTADVPKEARLEDLNGAFPRAKVQHTELEQKILNAF